MPSRRLRIPSETTRPARRSASERPLGFAATASLLLSSSRAASDYSEAPRRGRFAGTPEIHLCGGTPSPTDEHKNDAHRGDPATAASPGDGPGVDPKVCGEPPGALPSTGEPEVGKGAGDLRIATSPWADRFDAPRSLDPSHLHAGPPNQPTTRPSELAPWRPLPRPPPHWTVPDRRHTSGYSRCCS